MHDVAPTLFPQDQRRVVGRFDCRDPDIFKAHDHREGTDGRLIFFAQAWSSATPALMQAISFREWKRNRRNCARPARPALSAAGTAGQEGTPQRSDRRCLGAGMHRPAHRRRRPAFRESDRTLAAGP